MRTKVTRVRAGEAWEPKSEAAVFGRSAERKQKREVQRTHPLKKPPPAAAGRQERSLFIEPSSKKPPAKKKWIILAAVAIVLAAFYLWYTRPIPFQELIPGTELPPCQQLRVHASYEGEGGDREEYELTIPSEDPAFDPLLSLFTDRSYRRSLWNLLPRGGRIHDPQPGDFQWQVYLDYEEPITLPDGSQGSGTLFHFTNFYGALDVSVLGEDQRSSTDQQEQWLRSVMEAIESCQNANN